MDKITRKWVLIGALWGAISMASLFTFGIMIISTIGDNIIVGILKSIVFAPALLSWFIGSRFITEDGSIFIFLFFMVLGPFLPILIGSLIGLFIACAIKKLTLLKVNYANIKEN